MRHAAIHRSFSYFITNKPYTKFYFLYGYVKEPEDVETKRQQSSEFPTHNSSQLDTDYNPCLGNKNCNEDAVSAEYMESLLLLSSKSIRFIRRGNGRHNWASVQIILHDKWHCHLKTQTMNTNSFCALLNGIYRKGCCNELCSTFCFSYVLNWNAHRCY